MTGPQINGPSPHVLVSSPHAVPPPDRGESRPDEPPARQRPVTQRGPLRFDESLELGRDRRARIDALVARASEPLGPGVPATVGRIGMDLGRVGGPCPYGRDARPAADPRRDAGPPPSDPPTVVILLEAGPPRPGGLLDVIV